MGDLGSLSCCFPLPKETSFSVEYKTCPLQPLSGNRTWGRHSLSLKDKPGSCIQDFCLHLLVRRYLVRWPHFAAKEAGICGLCSRLAENLFLLKRRMGNYETLPVTLSNVLEETNFENTTYWTD